MDRDALNTPAEGLIRSTDDGYLPASYHRDGFSSTDDHRSSINDKGEEGDIECFWRFTDFGHVGERSRDGSIHSTDEVFNSISHLAGFFMSVLATAILVTEASAQGAPWKIVSFSIYGASLCFLFGASTLHHAITTTPEWERFFQKWDYLAIFPLIAGTFTPLCLVYFPYTTVGWTFFAVVWTLSLSSMFFTGRYFDKAPKWLTMTMYVTLGWLGAFMTFWLLPVMGYGGVGLMVFGGALYTIGGFIYTTEQPNPYPGRFGFHELWHIFVILAAATHWFMMYQYVLKWERPV